jgi:hypothetical protein
VNGKGSTDSWVSSGFVEVGGETRSANSGGDREPGNRVELIFKKDRFEIARWF